VIELDSELGPNWDRTGTELGPNWDQNMPVKALNEFEVLIRWPVPLAPPPRRFRNVSGDGLNIER